MNLQPNELPSPDNSWERLCICPAQKLVHCFNVLRNYSHRKEYCLINVYLKYDPKLGWNSEMLGFLQRCLPRFTNLSDCCCLKSFLQTGFSGTFLCCSNKNIFKSKEIFSWETISIHWKVYFNNSAFWN